MLISNDSNAAQARESGQEMRFYDDIGCLAADATTGEADIVRYVQLESGAWASTDAAWFGRPLGVKTPMDYGVVAFKTREEAQMKDRDRQARSWPGIVEIARTR